jgi:dynein heavy chain
VLFAAIPLMMITAVTKAQKKSMQGDYGPNGPYDCPVYKYPARTGRYFIFEVQLPSRDKPPLHYTLRGTALLCATE